MSDEIAESTVIHFMNDIATDACLGMFKHAMFNSTELQPTVSFNLTKHIIYNLKKVTHEKNSDNF